MGLTVGVVVCDVLPVAALVPILQCCVQCIIFETNLQTAFFSCNDEIERFSSGVSSHHRSLQRLAAAFERLPCVVFQYKERFVFILMY